MHREITRNVGASVHIRSEGSGGRWHDLAAVIGGPHISHGFDAKSGDALSYLRACTHEGYR